MSRLVSRVLGAMTPPVLQRAVGKLIGHPIAPRIWRGQYARVQDVPRVGSGFEDRVHLRDVRDHTSMLLRAARESGAPLFEPGVEPCLLALLAAMCAQASGHATILDFGGAMGADYVRLRSHFHPGVAIRYAVVESHANCVHGRELHGDDGAVSFHESFPSDVGPVDIVYVCSALQYLEDYGGTLARLCAYRPRFVFLEKLSAVDGPTYATAQVNMPGSVVPYWFLGRDEVVRIVEEHGYDLLVHGVLERVYDQTGFPAEWRMHRASRLVFERRAGGSSEGVNA